MMCKSNRKNNLLSFWIGKMPLYYWLYFARIIKKGILERKKDVLIT